MPVSRTRSPLACTKPYEESETPRASVVCAMLHTAVRGARTTEKKVMHGYSLRGEYSRRLGVCAPATEATATAAAARFVRIPRGTEAQYLGVCVSMCVRCAGLDSPGFNTRYRGDCCVPLPLPLFAPFSLAQREGEARGPKETVLPAALHSHSSLALHTVSRTRSRTRPGSRSDDDAAAGSSPPKPGRT